MHSTAVGDIRARHDGNGDPSLGGIVCSKLCVVGGRLRSVNVFGSQDTQDCVKSTQEADDSSLPLSKMLE